MAKKSKSKTPREVQDDTAAVEEEKPSSSAKRPTSETKKRKKPEAEKAKKPDEDAAEKPASPAKKPTSEIDDIFAAKKRKNPESKKAKKPNEDTIEKPKKLKNKRQDREIKDTGFGDLPSRPKKRTQDGLAIYSEEELGLNKADAGNTPLCPFDCSCCF